ncbi:MAG: hypothetical protein H7146_05490 [Burkholderiaceae bacterium]|nr:hypothetical protein [Microbacteriaceae bacterium]
MLSILAVSLAQANLLLVLGERLASLIRWGLIVTVGAIAVVGVMASLPILTDGDIPGEFSDGYWRLLGVIAIVDVLGSIVLPIVSRFLRDPAAGGALPPAAGATATATATQAVRELLARGQDPAPVSPITE